MKARTYRTTAEAIKAGMAQVHNEVIRVAEKAGTKILILGKKGQMLRLTPKQMRARIKREEQSKRQKKIKNS